MSVSLPFSSGVAAGGCNNALSGESGILDGILEMAGPVL
jgi:hypothetical protein